MYGLDVSLDFFKICEKKGTWKMKIQKLSVVVDGDNKNILVSESIEDYAEVDMLSGPEEIVQVMEKVFHLSDKAEEYLYLICMTPHCQPIGFFEVAHGTHDTVVVGIREIFVRALLCGATDIVIVHNHPGGCPEPTEKESFLTQKIQIAAELMGITFCDHIIISRDSYSSFSEHEKAQGSRNEVKKQTKSKGL